MGMSGYTKLFNSILASTIWRADDKTRIVWITLLAMADKNGVSEGSIPGLADLARVSIEDTEKALAILQEPDRYSRSQEHDGRRIRPVDGGWQILNHAKYRAKLHVDERREYLRVKQQESRQRRSTTVNSSQSHVDGSTQSTQAEAEAQSEKKTIAAPLLSSEHQAFIQGWMENFKDQFKFDYSFDGGKDAKAVKELLRLNILRLDLLEIAKGAWKRGIQPPKSFACTQAATIHGFRHNLNQIRTELSEMYRADKKPDPSVQSVDHYLNAIEKL